MAKIIGYFTQSIIDLLGINYIPAGSPIFIGESNIEHMKSRHPYEFDRYFSDISSIISNPDYIGIHPSDSSIAFVKEYITNSEYVKVAVKISGKGKCFAKSLHILSTCNANRYIEHGTLKKLDK